MKAMESVVCTDKVKEAGGLSDLKVKDICAIRAMLNGQFDFRELLNTYTLRARLRPWMRAPVANRPLYTL